MANPKSSTEFLAGDRIGLIGEPEQLENALAWLAGQPELDETPPLVIPPVAAAAPGS
jgi:hypothetical protein